MKNFWKNKKVVVSGAGGFIGSAMVKELVLRGSRVTACISLRDKKRHTDTNVSWLHLNGLIYEDCKKALQSQDVVLHFAGMDGGQAFKREHSAEIFRTNTQLALNILEASREDELRRVLMISSIEVYSPRAKSPVTEGQGFLDEPKEDISGYAWSKRFIEIASEIYYRQYRLPLAIARLGNIYGPGDDLAKQRVIPAFIDRISKGEVIRIYDPKRKISFLYIDDLIRTLLDLTEKYALGDPVNIVGSQKTTITELVALIGKLLNKKPLINIHKSAHGKGQVFSIQKARNILGFHEKTTLEQGLRKIIKT